MNKKKLSIKKFTISKLSNPSKIVGGGDDGETGKRFKCVDLSKRWVEVKEQRIE